MGRTYYHGTTSDRVPSILRDGLRPGEDGIVWLTSDRDTAFHNGAMRQWDAARRYSSVRPALVAVRAIPMGPKVESHGSQDIKVMGALPPELIEEEPLNADEAEQYEFSAGIRRRQKLHGWNEGTNRMKTLRELAQEAQEELPSDASATSDMPDEPLPTVGSSTTPTRHPAAENSGNPLLEDDLEEAHPRGAVDPDDSEFDPDPVDSPDVDEALDTLLFSVKREMEEVHGQQGWGQSAAFRMMQEAIEKAIRDNATPQRKR
jgi:hypothetical protein